MKVPRRGTVLIVVLGMLVLLALLATSFATLQSIERKITRNYTDEVRARLVAQSGVESAIARMQAVIDKGWFDRGGMDKQWIYFGSELNESSSPQVSTPLEQAKNPSFAHEDEYPQNPSDATSTPKQIRIEGAVVGFSGVVGGTYTQSGDLFTLRVLDAQSMININDGAAWGPNHSVSQNLRRILNILGEQPAVQSWKRSPSDKLGDLIVNNRPPGGYQSKLELLRLFDNDERRFEAIRSMLTAHSWRNPQVANPVPLSQAALSAYPSEITYTRPQANGVSTYRYGHGKNALGAQITAPLMFYTSTLPDAVSTPPFYSAVWSMDALHPQWIELVERAPVNINTASLEVLASLITDLEGFFLTSRRRPSPPDIFYQWLDQRCSYDAAWDTRENKGLTTSDEIGFLYRTIPFAGPGSRLGSSTTIGAGTLPAGSIALEILFCRDRQISTLTGNNYAVLPFGGPFKTWAQFNAFVDNLVGPNGLIWDSRPVFWDYTGSATIPGGGGSGGSVTFTSSKPITVLSADTTLTVTGAGSTRVQATGTGTIKVTAEASIGISSSGASSTSSSTVSVNGKTTCTASVTLGGGGGPTATPVSVTARDSFAQRWHASKAAADVLKANFNPNLHLNELNPDRSLFLHVDKTDLIVNSTELCFVPMGIFEVESLGYVLTNNGVAGGTTLAGSLGPLETADNQVVAKSRILATVKLYDAAYESTQSRFYQGTFAPRASFGVTTNNNASVETGPEPDNGPQPMKVHYDGWVSLPTRLGSFSTAPKPRGALMTSYQGSNAYGGVARAPAENPEFDESIHAHFQLDHVAGYHVAGNSPGLPLGAFANTGEKSLNFPDRTETRPGPYGPVDSPNYRLADTFVLPSLESARATANDPALASPPSPSLPEYARSDLRLDGMYADLHSAVGYSLSDSKFVKNAVLSFWYKPNYFPETSGRIRNLVSIKDYNQVETIRNYGYLPLDYPLPFSAYILPSWHTPEEPYLPSYGGPARRMSILWAIGADRRFVSIGGGVGANTITLNHEFEPQVSTPEDSIRFTGKTDGKWNWMRSHEWSHVVLSCEAGSGFNAATNSAATPPRLKAFVNGRLVSGSSSPDPDIRVHVPDGPEDFSIIHGLSVRLGGELSLAAAEIPRQYYGDGTIDEFFMWIDRGIDKETNALDIYKLGRYYRANDSIASDAVFTSAPVPISAPYRRLPPASTITAPGSTGTELTLPAPVPESQIYVIGVAWTAVAEDYGAGEESDRTPRLKPIIWDYAPQLSGLMPRAYSPDNVLDRNNYAYETVCDLSVRVGAQTYGPYRHEGWSPVRASHGAGAISTGDEGPVPVPPSDEVRYSAKLRVGPIDRLNAVLLAAPVLDDVTIFYSTGRSRFLSYAEDPR